MLLRSTAGALALAATLLMTSASASAGDAFPDWRGQWLRIDHGHGPQFDPDKPAGRGQQVPLNAEYQAIFEANLKSLASGTQPYNPQLGCLPPGSTRQPFSTADSMMLAAPMNSATKRLRGVK